MSETNGSPASVGDWSGERTITEFFPAPRESGAIYKLANKIPLGLGLLIYAPAYVARALNPFGVIRYTLTDRRLRVDRGTTKSTIRFVPLEDIDEIRVRDYAKFTRTGDLDIIHKGEVVLTMVGIQDPEPVRKTILDAVKARVLVQKILAEQAKNRETVTT